MDSGVFSALAYLERAQPPHRMPMSELQRAMHPRYSQPGFSRLVQRMEADGLVERRADPTDRRATIVVTTRTGRRQFTAANAVYVDALPRCPSAATSTRPSTRAARVHPHRRQRPAVVALLGGRVGFGATLDNSLDVGSGGMTMISIRRCWAIAAAACVVLGACTSQSAGDDDSASSATTASGSGATSCRRDRDRQHRRHHRGHDQDLADRDRPVATRGAAPRAGDRQRGHDDAGGHRRHQRQGRNRRAQGRTDPARARGRGRDLEPGPRAAGVHPGDRGRQAVRGDHRGRDPRLARAVRGQRPRRADDHDGQLAGEPVHERERSALLARRRTSRSGARSSIAPGRGSSTMPGC